MKARLMESRARKSTTNGTARGPTAEVAVASYEPPLSRIWKNRRIGNRTYGGVRRQMERIHLSPKNFQNES